MVEEVEIHLEAIAEVGEETAERVEEVEIGTIEETHLEIEVKQEIGENIQEDLETGPIGKIVDIEAQAPAEIEDLHHQAKLEEDINSSYYIHLNQTTKKTS